MNRIYYRTGISIAFAIKISIALLIQSLDSRLRRKWTVYLRHHMHYYSSEMV